MLLQERFAAQLLTAAGSRPRDPAVVVRHLLAIQAQDPRGARLAIRVRSTGVTAPDVDRALDDRALVVSWLNRGTLHLVTAEDYGWLHALTTPRLLTGVTRRLRQEGVSEAQAEQGVRTVVRAIERDGPRTRLQLAEALAGQGVPTKGQALVHVLALTSLRGHVVRGPMVEAHQAYVLVADWLGKQPRVDRDTALAELARRYLAGHGPASDRDLAKWAGLPLRDARIALRYVDLADRDDGLAALPSAPEPGGELGPTLFGAYEPVLMGWTSRREVLGDHDGDVVSGGLFRPFAYARGRAVGTWRIAGDEVRVEPFGRLTDDFDREAKAVSTFLGGTSGRTSARRR